MSWGEDILPLNNTTRTTLPSAVVTQPNKIIYDVNYRRYSSEIECVLIETMQCIGSFEGLYLDIIIY